MRRDGRGRCDLAWSPEISRAQLELGSGSFMVHRTVTPHRESLHREMDATKLPTHLRSNLGVEFWEIWTIRARWCARIPEASQNRDPGGRREVDEVDLPATSDSDGAVSHLALGACVDQGVHQSRGGSRRLLPGVLDEGKYLSPPMLND